VEACAVIRKEQGEAGVAELHGFLALLQIEVVPFDHEQALIASEASRQFGRGTQHPAKLNLGDLFPYALAKQRDEPMLFKGNDFIHTDIKPA
jgi:ribonuclease VapC